ncbi:MAG: nitrilase-related carbon-nitrogen hydrolase [Candidatus Thorarchaeota archaeon]
MRIAVGQLEPKLVDAQENLTRLREILKQADDKHVEVLVLPELCNSGYVFKSLEEATSVSERIPSGDFSEELVKWTKSDRLVVAGLCEQTSQGLYNSAAVFAQGNHLATYRKIHLFLNEKDWFKPGDEEPPVVEFNGAKFGVMICFDWAFPEVARILTLKGAQVILHPANLVLPYCQSAMVTRSIENSVFTATANRIGIEREIGFSGNSQITSTNGTRLVTLPSNEVGIACVDIDPINADDKMISKRNHIIHDRRPELYSRLVKSD